MTYEEIAALRPGSKVRRTTPSLRGAILPSYVLTLERKVHQLFYFTVYTEDGELVKKSWSLNDYNLLIHYELFEFKTKDEQFLQQLYGGAT